MMLSQTMSGTILEAQVVLGQNGLLGPGTDDALTDHVGNTAYMK